MSERTECAVFEKTRMVRLYIAEEQELLREAYKVALRSEPNIEITGLSGDTGTENITHVLSATRPDAILLGTTEFQSGTVELLGIIRESFQHIGIVILSLVYDTQAVKELRRFEKGNLRGCAFLLKSSLDKASQLTQVVHAVIEGQVVIAPVVMEGLIGADKRETIFMEELTSKELKVLSWMAKGYRNDTIADFLGVIPKTIERHINSIYGKLDGVLANSRQRRVGCILLYLKATGQLPQDG